MSKFFLVVPLVFFIIKSNAQFSIGISAGYANNHLQTDISNRILTQNKNGSDFAASIMLNYKCCSRINFQTEINLFDKSYSLVRSGIYEGLYTNYKNKYLQLPIIFQYKFLQNTRCQFFVDAGLFFSNWVSGKIKGAIPNVFNSYDSINSSGQIKHYLRYTNYSEKYQFNSVKDNRYEFGALLGITTIYQLNQKYSIFYSVRFCQSFVSQQKKYSINQTAQYNQTIMISIGCKFSLHDLKMNDHAK